MFSFSKPFLLLVGMKTLCLQNHLRMIAGFHWRGMFVSLLSLVVNDHTYSWNLHVAFKSLHACLTNCGAGPLSWSISSRAHTIRAWLWTFPWRSAAYVLFIWLITIWILTQSHSGFARSAHHKMRAQSYPINLFLKTRGLKALQVKLVAHVCCE